MGLRDFFRRRTHREKYEEAEERFEKAEHESSTFDQRAYNRQKNKADREEHFSYAGPDYDWFFPISENSLKTSERNYDRAKKRLNKLYAQGQNDAIKLNKEYDRLFSDYKRTWNEFDAAVKSKKSPAIQGKLFEKTQEASNALNDFQKEKLGIKEPLGALGRMEERRKNLGALTGMISVASFILASFIATDITGNVVNNTANLSFSNGTIFLLIGIVFGIAWLILRR